MYYADPVRQQRLDVLLHLTQNSNELLVIIGEEGMGKTTFVNQFLQHAPDHWKICFVNGHKMMTEEQFLERVYMGFNIAHASIHKGTMLSNLRKRLENMLENAIPIILVIDDAQLFSTKVLALILEIASIKNTKTGGSVRVLLACEPQIKILLAEPALDEAHDLIVRKIDLPPMDETNTGNYLHHRLSQAGMVVEQFLTKPTISKIYKNSDGVPKRINEAADKLLFDTTPIIRRNSHIQSEKQLSILKLIVIVLVITAFAGIAGYFYSLQTDSEDSKARPDESSETHKTLKLPPETALPDSPEKSTVEKTGTETSDPMQLLKDELTDQTNPAQTTSPTVSLPQVSETEKATQPPPEQSTAIWAEPTQPQNTPTVQSANISPANDIGGIKDNNWMLAQNPDHYTLQLVAGRQKQTINNFIEKYKLKDDLIYFSSKRKGKIWHNLSYGVYPDRKSANLAIKKLPSILAVEKPWIRSISAIQVEIRQLNQSEASN